MDLPAKGGLSPSNDLNVLNKAGTNTKSNPTISHPFLLRKTVQSVVSIRYPIDQPDNRIIGSVICTVSQGIFSPANVYENKLVNVQNKSKATTGDPGMDDIDTSLADGVSSVDGFNSYS